MRLLKSLDTVLRYLIVLVLGLAGFFLAREGVQQDDTGRIVIGVVIALAAIVWAVVGRARGADLLP